MSLSFFVPLALVASLGLGLALMMLAIVSLMRPKGRVRWRTATAAILAALTINSWWLAFGGLVFYKLFVLREDT